MKCINLKWRGINIIPLYVADLTANIRCRCVLFGGAERIGARQFSRERVVRQLAMWKTCIHSRLLILFGFCLLLETK